MKRKVVVQEALDLDDDYEEDSTRELDPITGFIPDTDQDIITRELMEGGESRADIVERVTELLEPYTRNGKPKQVVNLVGNVIMKLKDRGWHIESHFKMIPPKDQDWNNADSGE